MSSSTRSRNSIPNSNNNMNSSSNSNKRRRTRRPPPHFTMDTAAEERLLQQAIQNSKWDSRTSVSGLAQIPWGPVFYATVDDFTGNPLAYIERIRHVAEPFGICKIVPPKGWNPTPFCIKDDSKEEDQVHEADKKRFQTKLQVLHRLQEGISYGDGVEYTVSEYLKTAARRTQEWKAQYYPDHDLLSRHAQAVPDSQTKRFVPENLEADYWSIVENTKSHQVTVEYGNDVDTATFGSAFPVSQRGRSVHSPPAARPVTPNSSENEDDDPPIATTTGWKEPDFGTPEYYQETFWNLNNMPNAPGSILQHVKVGINGINVPWMYYGSLFTTFAYHNEDNYLYSINYHHRGAPKQWYGVPGDRDAADGLEKVFKSYLSMKMRDVPDLLHHITTMFSPRLLQNAGVPVCKLIQHEGEFVVTFPRAFHGGFSYGPNAGEAVNFASHDWIQYGADANERYRSFARPAVFSHDRLTLTMANHLQDQTSYASCRLLLDELERVVQEEIDLRGRLEAHGVRDVSNMIQLPANRLDQLDEKSAAYDDKRLCHACKHVCFFSAVACECSQSKVSCLRHSHFMCRCPPEKKYFMIWSPKEELESTLARVRTHCQGLENEEKEKGNQETTKDAPSKEETVPSTEGTNDAANTSSSKNSPRKGGRLPPFGPGAERDMAWHKRDEIPTGYLLDPEYQPCYSVRTDRSQLEQEVEQALAAKIAAASLDKEEEVEETNA